MKKMFAVTLLALAAASPAAAATTVFDFDTLNVGEFVGTYNGAVFNNFIVQTNFGQTSQPNFSYNTASSAGFDFAAGFTSIDFTSGVFSPFTVSVYSGLGGTGTLLGATVVTDPPASPAAFGPVNVAFAGTGKSVVVTGVSGQFAWDDITVTTAAVPEPQSWAMLIAGFGLVGAVARRRRTALTA